MSSQHHITSLLSAAQRGNRAALDELFPIIYEELHNLAQSQRRRWHGNHTVNTTALVHEAYLKLVRQEEVQWKDRAHFFALAARAMRHILSNYARDQQAAKRGGNVEKVSLDAAPPGQAPYVPEESLGELIALDDALTQLEQLNERQSRVVECRFFAGLSVKETAAALDISPATVKRDWSLASAWLRRQIDPSKAD